MVLDDSDIALLNSIGCEEPWHLIAAAFRQSFENPQELVNRLFRLRKEGALAIVPDTAAAAETSEAVLLRDAMENAWYEGVIWPDGPTWSLRVTKAGFAALDATGRSEWESGQSESR